MDNVGFLPDCMHKSSWRIPGVSTLTLRRPQVHTISRGSNAVDNSPPNKVTKPRIPSKFVRPQLQECGIRAWERGLRTWSRMLSPRVGSQLKGTSPGQTLSSSPALTQRSKGLSKSVAKLPELKEGQQQKQTLGPTIQRPQYTIPLLESAKVSEKSVGLIKGYAANTHKGHVRYTSCARTCLERPTRTESRSSSKSPGRRISWFRTGRTFRCSDCMTATGDPRVQITSAITSTIWYLPS